jgi:hypothetical protein
MSDVVKRAEEAVQQARRDTVSVELVAALLAAQQQAQQPACQHQQQAPAAVPSSAGKWLAVGVAGSFLAVALAVSMVAFAIGAVSLTVCVVVLRSVWQQWQQERKD